MYALRKIEEWKFQAPWRKENVEEIEQVELENEELSDGEKLKEQQQMHETRERLMIEAGLHYRMF